RPILLRDLQNRFCLCLGWVQDRTGAHVKWKHESVAKTISVKELGRRERNVAAPDAQYAACITLTALDPVLVQMHGGFWTARATATRCWSARSRRRFSSCRSMLPRTPEYPGALTGLSAPPALPDRAGRSQPD